jgi:hypothetical protein
LRACDYEVEKSRKLNPGLWQRKSRTRWIRSKEFHLQTQKDKYLCFRCIGPDTLVRAVLPDSSIFVLNTSSGEKDFHRFSKLHCLLF